jgi:hypothetical protein
MIPLTSQTPASCQSVFQICSYQVKNLHTCGGQLYEGTIHIAEALKKDQAGDRMNKKQSDHQCEAYKQQGPLHINVS